MYPAIGIGIVIVWILQLLMIKNPLLIIFALLLALLGLYFSGSLHILKSVIKHSKWLVLMILIINPLIAGLGETKLFGRITMESLAYSAAVSVKLILTIAVMRILVLINDKEDLYTFFHKYFRKLTLTLSMSSNAVDSLKSEYDRVKMVMTTRGMPIESGSFSERMIRTTYLIKAVFIGILEGTFDRSEALYVRNFTDEPSTEYRPLLWKRSDSIFLIILAVNIICLLIGVGFKMYDFQYYPKMWGNTYLLPFVALFTTVFSAILGLREKKKDDKF